MKRFVLIIVFLAVPAFAATIHVPVDQPTIQDGITAASDGDTVLVAAGDYDEGAVLQFLGKDVVVVSESGASSTKILSEVEFGLGDTLGPVLEGFEVKRIVVGSLANPTVRACLIHNDEFLWILGAGCYIASGDVLFEECIFDDNWTMENGGGVFIEGANSRVEFVSCSFTNNYARIRGAGLCAEDHSVVKFSECDFVEQVLSELRGTDFDCFGCDSIVAEDCSFIPRDAGFIGLWDVSLMPVEYARLSGCTFAGPGQNYAAVIMAWGQSEEAEIVIENTVISGCYHVLDLMGWTGQLTVDCCVFHDFNSVEADNAPISGYANADPLFCDPDNRDYSVSEFSPCAAAYSPCGEPVGRYAVGCTSTYICGDANADGIVNITDAVHLVNYVFVEGSLWPSPPIAGDANCDNLTNITDVVYLIAYIFDDGPLPCAECP